MRFHNALNPVLGSPSKLGLLRTMFGSANRHWTGRELARAAGVSAAQAARDLAGLADTSLISREVFGRSYSWQLNPSHVLMPVLADLFRREGGFRSEMLRTVSEGLRVARFERARVFGSIPRGEERADSDVDLFLQVRTSDGREKAEAAVERVRSDVWSRFGNPVSAIIYTRAEIARPRNPALLRAIEEEGIDVIGRA
jgi:predicted nucleotidyltransferase